MLAAIIIPALNEEATVAAVVAGVAGLGIPVVVSDGSIDATVERAREAGAVVVEHQSNLGYDSALASGFEEAMRHRVEAVVSFDADGQFAPCAVSAVLAPLETGAFRVAVGIRPEKARFAESLFGYYTDMRFGVPDILCGVKAISTPVYLRYRELASLPSINTALVLAALRDGESVARVDVTVRPRADTPRFGSRWRANLRIFAGLAAAVRDDFRSSLPFGEKSSGESNLHTHDNSDGRK